MDVSYYPGCSLHGTAREYGESTLAVAERLGVHLHELEDWTCCGASSAHATSEQLSIDLAARNLRIADSTGLDLVVPCASCFQRLKRAEKHLGATRGEKKARVRYMVDLFGGLGGKAISEKVKKPLMGLKPVCYYGCLTSRPPQVTDARDPERPEAMDNLVKVLGAEVREWSGKTDCCGGNLAFTRPDVAARLTGNLLRMAQEAGANCIVTGCPLCQSNLDMGQYQLPKNGRQDLPVFYFTELMALAFGEPSGWLRAHMIDPRPLLASVGLNGRH